MMQRSGAPRVWIASIARRTLERLLADRDIDANNVAVLLVDDRVDRNRGLADGAIADDEFALAAAEREQRIDYDEPGLDRLRHQIPVDDRRRRALDRLQRLARDGTFPVERAAERIDDAAEQRRPHRGADDVAEAAHRVAGLHRIGVVEQDAAHPVAFEHLDEAELPLVETQEFVEADVRHPGDERDAVADLLHPADLFSLRPERGRPEPCAGAIEPGVGGGVRLGCHR